MSKLDEIYNFAQVSDTLGTGGQPKPEQFSTLKEAGYQIIISLTDGTTKHDLPNEGDICEELDLDYHHLPVDWASPTQDSLKQFFDVMDANADEKIFVHCIANYRVAAFIMLYRVIKQGVSLTDANTFKDSVWKPDDVYPIWDTFIAETLKQHGIEES